MRKHRDYWVSERKSYYIRRRNAVLLPDESVVLIIDSMDQNNAVYLTCSQPKSENVIRSESRGLLLMVLQTLSLHLSTQSGGATQMQTFTVFLQSCTRFIPLISLIL